MSENAKADPYEAPADTWPKKGSSGNGTDHAYTVEARLAYPEPRSVVGQILDTRWRQVAFVESTVGVPARPRYAPWGAFLSDKLSYQAAQALRWWFLANAEQEFSCLCIETRLVEHEIKYSYSSTAIKAGALIGGEDRSNIMFDWGKKEPPPLPAKVA